MIVNMPAASGSNTLSAIEAAQGQCEYNFLKRKLDVEDNLLGAQSINNGNGNATDTYQGAAMNSWKKRHLEEASSNAASCFSVHNFGANPLNEFSNGNESAAAAATTANANDMAFNLIGSNFINDLFAYDANLIVPVSANLVSSASTLCGTSTIPTYAAQSNVCTSSGYDDGSHWQASDLLELDHRYNSGLQTEITQLNPTVSLKPTQRDATELCAQQTAQTTPPTNFLVPEVKQVSRPSSAQAEYRQENSLPNTLTPTQQGNAEADFEDKNLSWLLNFKFDELPHLSPEVSGNNANSVGGANSTQNAATSGGKSTLPEATLGQASAPVNSHNKRSPSPKMSTKAGKKFEELVMEVTSEMDGNDMIVAENVVVEDSSIRAPKKPPFTYTELIEYALEDKGELTVSGIYQWISDRFPYYKSNDDRWKNSVRHNLSINPHFRKGVKAPQGAGHLWTISSGDSAENVLAWEHKKQRLDLFFKMESMNRERLKQHHQQLQQQQQQQHLQTCSSPHQDCQQEQCLYDEAAAAAAAITQEMLQQHGAQNCSDHINASSSAGGGQRQGAHVMHELPFNDLMSDEELRKTAGQILNGIHREVEVQSVNSIISTYHDVLLDNEDYLNPIHKDVAVNESGLRHTATSHAQAHANAAPSQYYVTEIDPMELGIQMSHHNVETEEALFNDEFNLNYFGYNAGNDIVA